MNFERKRREPMQKTVVKVEEKNYQSQIISVCAKESDHIFGNDGKCKTCGSHRMPYVPAS